MKQQSVVIARGFGAGVITDMDHAGLIRVAKSNNPDAPAKWMREKDVLTVVAF